jgi:hypothetical protein
MDFIFEELQTLHTILSRYTKYWDKNTISPSALDEELSDEELLKERTKEVLRIVKYSQTVPIEYKYLFEACIAQFTEKLDLLEEERQYDEVIRDIQY